MAAVTFICMPIAGIIALSVVWLYCLIEVLRFTMLCSHGVWRAVIIFDQFPKVIAIFVKSILHAKGCKINMSK